MRIASIGIGGAGSRVVDALWRDNNTRRTPYLASACAVDTDMQALEALQVLPADNRHVFGVAETDGTGTDGDRSTGTAAIEGDLLETRRAIDPYITGDVDAIFLVAGLAGGTGGGATPHIAAALRDIYEQPIYAVTILPAGQDEHAAQNAVQSLETVKSTTDAQILFDNDHWLGTEESISENAETLNTVLTDRLGELCAAGEVDGAETVGQRVVDTSEIIATLSGSGFTTLGHASQDVQSTTQVDKSSVRQWLQRTLLGGSQDSVDEIAAYKIVETTLRQAVRGKLTIDCDEETAERGLVVLAGPPEWLSRDAIADGRSWIETELSPIRLRSGDVPMPTASRVSVLAVFHNVKTIPRISELKNVSTHSSTK